IEKVKSGYDLVLGSRFQGKIQHMPWLKRLGNIAFSYVLSSLTKTKITDSTTGFRGFTAEIAREINYINTFTYTQEQIIKAAKQGFKITEIPIIARKTRASRLFKSPFQYALKAWINIFRIYRDYEPLLFFGKIGTGLFTAGVLLGCWLVYRFLTLGYVGRTPSIILSLLLILMGIQIVLFGFLADMMKKLV
ncbi:MAG TPA: glycosyltransferase family 2 protein, partial [Candidatus Nanoarchaeia archaeon]|nr:glycosyltransferase family 2 protein [Candidatus Nanoarchaeia archaeon]